MPSAKGKKHSKTQSRLSNSSDNFSSNGSLDFEETEEGFASSIEQASIKYPSLITKFAFVARVADVQDDPKSCKIWLSEPSMVAASFTPGSIVSVNFSPFRLVKQFKRVFFCFVFGFNFRCFGIGLIVRCRFRARRVDIQMGFLSVH